MSQYGKGVGSDFLQQILTPEQNSQLAQQRHKLLHHPLWQGLETKETSKEHLATFAIQDAWLIREVHRLDGLAIAKAPDMASARYLIAKLLPKSEAAGSIERFGQALGLRPEVLAKPRPLAGCAALTAQFYYHLTRSSFAQTVACIGTSETIFLEICGRIETPLLEQYGFRPEEIHFFCFHRQLEEAERQLNELLGSLVQTPAQRDTVFAAVEMCYDFEQLFYDTVWQNPYRF